MVKVHCIADLHGDYPSLPGGHILIVAGDLTGNDQKIQFNLFEGWLAGQPYKHKVVVAGNHDQLIFMREYSIKNAHYLEDSMIELEGLKIYGSPWNKRFHGQNPSCAAFSLWTEKELAEYFQHIPEGLDILVTHSPPIGILDRGWFGRAGSEALLERVNKVKPRVHVFGHLHEGRGMVESRFTKSINCAHLAVDYVETRGHMEFELDPLNEIEVKT